MLYYDAFYICIRSIALENVIISTSGYKVMLLRETFLLNEDMIFLGYCLGNNFFY